MELGIVGLGRMGANMARRLIGKGHDVVVTNRTLAKVEQLEEEGARGASSLEGLVGALAAPRVVWLMLPAGAPTQDALDQLIDLLDEGDIIVEGGNTHFEDDRRRSAAFAERGIRYLDAGVSGGLWGRDLGYCTMVGGEEEAFGHIEPLLADLSTEDGYLYCGASGSGHFVKMAHNGIEYALMEAYGEGFELLKASPYGASLDLEKVAQLWNHGSIIRSWLLELIESAFGRDGKLESIQGYVEDSGEGRWTVQQAVELGVAAPVIAQSLFKRFQSRQTDTFSDKVVAALRKEFGGHAVARAGEELRTEAAGAGAVRAARPDAER